MYSETEQNKALQKRALYIFYHRLYRYSKTENKKALYIFPNRVYSEPFSFNFGVPRYYVDFFRLRKIRISVFYMIEHVELVYIPQNKVKKGIVYFFLEIIFRAILLLTLGCLNNIQTFLDPRKFRISLFYMREHSELVYIHQKRIEQGIVYFF